MDIFKINNEGILEINKAEARNTPVYKAILARDKGSEGDHDGRKKIFAFKELMFVHTYYHPFSKYRDLDDDQRKASCIINAELPQDWEPDNLIEEAGKQLIGDLDLSALYYTYINTSRTIRSMGDDVKFFNRRRVKLRDKIETLMTSLDSGELDEEESEKAEIQINTLTNSLMTISKSINSLNAELPEAYDTLEKIKQKLIEEENSGSQIRGGGELGNREE